MSLHEQVKALDIEAHKRHIEEFGWTKVVSPENDKFYVVIRKAKEWERPSRFIVIHSYVNRLSVMGRMVGDELGHFSKDLRLLPMLSCLLFLAGHVLATLEGVDPHSGAPLSESAECPATG